MNTLSRKKRLLVLFYITIFIMVIIFLRLGQIMFVKAGELEELAELQWTKELAVTAPRGSILDRNGEVLAQSASVKSVLLKPHDIKDPGEVSNLLAPILEMDPQEVYDAASNTKKTEIWLKRHITEEQEKQIRELGIKGVSFFIDTKRYYPYGQFMSQVIGYTNIDGEGQEGLEQKYNKYLAGYPGTMLALVDAQQNTVEGSETQYIDPVPGLNAVLTTDAAIQSFAENAAKEALSVNKAKAVSAVVMDPNNADILAMVNYPEADLNELPRDDISMLNELSRNRVVTDAYEPGSTFKIITTAAALDSGKTELAHTYTCTGSKVVGADRIKCWRTGRPHGTQTLIEAVENSCNPAFMEMALSMGTDTFYDYIYNYGFGSNTGIDYSTDGAGIVTDKKYVKNVDLARIGFGQSIAMTPLQLATAACATVNGGTLYTPRLVSHLTNKDGSIVTEFESNKVREVISEESSATMRTILESVVENGSGANAKVEGYRVGGKTGTAQMYEDGKIVDGKVISSFLGFAPADNPQFLVLFIVYEPGVPVTYGSVCAAPFVKDVLEKSLKYAEIPATAGEAVDTVEVPNFVGKTVGEAWEEADDLGIMLDGELEPDDVIALQSPASGTTVLKGSTIAVVSEDRGEAVADAKKVPDIVGMSVYDAYNALSSAGYEMELDKEIPGHDTIEEQSPKAGSVLASGGTVVVKCGAAKNIEE